MQAPCGPELTCRIHPVEWPRKEVLQVSLLDELVYTDAKNLGVLWGGMHPWSLAVEMAPSTQK
jgi:hypothetical protein